MLYGLLLVAIKLVSNADATQHSSSSPSVEETTQQEGTQGQRERVATWYVLLDRVILISMAGLAPRTIVLALGAAALGGPDALRVLLETAGRSPLHDILICVLAMAAVTAHVLGTTLLARFVRKARAGGGAPGTDLFACVTATVSVGAALLVTACLLLAGSGGLGALRLAFGFAAKNPIVTVTVLVIAAAAAAGVGGFLPYTMPLLRFGRRACAARGASPAGDRATFRQTLPFVDPLLVAACLALVVPLFTPGAIDARWSLLAAATVVGALLLARSPRRARDAAAPGKLTRGTAAFLAAVAVASLLVIPFAYAQPRRESGGGEYPCSV
ncbi:hypothetical protein C2845_PM10G05540 [Panicum miliaceum]|uniref:Uncharacterized protein n=1 Tax=Panicum miliaceum TaxID=4540 RepID=A0A3L6PC56_PANMI|nr:hypothetical protein C2845_PM10G05540 [Panicum miliaceum]